MTATIGTRTLPVIEVAGSPVARGRVHGEALRDVIHETIGRWQAALAARHAIAADAYLAEFLANTHYLPAIERYTPALLDEVRGIAEGAELSFETALAYNLMDEEWAYGEARRARQPGCTVACLMPAAGAPVVAQTMDIPSLYDGSQVAIRHRRDDGPDLVIFTGAGMLALNGANAPGIGVVVNNLSMLPASDRGLPVMFMIRGVLERTTLAEAAAFVAQTPHAIGQHYAIGGPDGIVGLEGAANGVKRSDAGTERYVHANHPLANLEVVGDPSRQYRASTTFERHARASELIAEASDQAGIESLLEDTAAPISRAPKAGFMTFGGTSIACSVPPVVHITAGPPHEAPWTNVAF
jgi:hypothetical protein